MTAARSLDLLFRDAVAAIDAGDVAALEGFFHRPYLLWFVAEDPVRHGRLPLLPG